LLDHAAGGLVRGTVETVRPDAAVAAVEREDVSSAKQVRLADDAGAAEGVSGAHESKDYAPF
jgi:hypothetical protein